MKATYDKHVNAAYIRIQEGKYYQSKRISPNVIYDYDKKGRLIGVELL